MLPRSRRALLLASLVSFLAACAPPPAEPIAPVATPAPSPPSPPIATAEPTSAPDPTPPAPPPPAALPALPPEDPALGKLRLRVHSPVDADNHDCMLPLIHQVTPLADGSAWVTGGCDMRLRAEGKRFVNQPAPGEKRSYRSDGHKETCQANTTFDALWAGGGKEPLVHSRYICGATSYPLGFRAIERFDGKRWSKVSTALPAGMSDDLFPDTIEGSKPEALWGLVPANLWSLLQGGKEAPLGGALYRLGPKGWEKAFRKQDVPARLQELAAGTELDHYAAMTEVGDELWLAGARLRWNGSALASRGARTWRWDGKRWTEQQPAATSLFYAISMASDGALWAASPGALWRWQNEAWSKVPLGLDPRTVIHALSAGSAADLWLLLDVHSDPGGKGDPPPVLAHHDGKRLATVVVEPAPEHPTATLASLGSAGARVWAWNIEDAWELVRPGDTAADAPVFTYARATSGKK
jgi:hypothetical protein